jgi:hypothetical protein
MPVPGCILLTLPAVASVQRFGGFRNEKPCLLFEDKDQILKKEIFI